VVRQLQAVNHHDEARRLAIATSIIRDPAFVEPVDTPTYRLNDPAKYLNLPHYSVEPSGSLSNFVYTLAIPEPYVTLEPQAGDIPRVKIYTTNTADYGFHFIEVVITETNSGLTDSYYVSLMIPCVTSVTLASSVANQIFVIGEDLYKDIAIPMNGYTLTPSICGAWVVLDTNGVTLADGSPLPGFFQVD